MPTVFHPEVWHISYLELGIRIVIAVVLGGLVGLERELGDHAAGFRTHILVCLGSALVVLLSIYGFAEFAEEPNVRMDPARLAAQVISGIGFLGAGTILRTGTTVSGLTTAASLWVVAAIGLAVGAGFYFGAFVGTFAVLICLFLLNKLEKTFSKSRKKRVLCIEVWDGNGNIGTIMTMLHKMGVQIGNIQIENRELPYEDGKRKAALMHMTVKTAKPKKFDSVLEAVATTQDVIRVETSLTSSTPTLKSVSDTTISS